MKLNFNFEPIVILRCKIAQSLQNTKYSNCDSDRNRRVYMVVYIYFFYAPTEWLGPVDWHQQVLYEGVA